MVLLAYFFGVAIVGALLSPPAYYLVRAIGNAVDSSFLLDLEFRKVANRTFLLCAMAGLCPMVRALGVKGRAEWGFGVPRALGRRALGVGLALGAAMIVPPVAVQILLGVQAWDNPTAAVLAAAVVGGLLSGLVISLIEETFFRGVLYAGFRRDLGTPAAIAATSLLYGLAHFVQGRANVTEVGWSSGFALLGGAFSKLREPASLGALLALLLLGVVLALVRARQGHILHTIGIHSALVAGVRVTRKAFDMQENSPHRWMVSVTYDKVTGYLTCFFLIAFLVTFWMWHTRGKTPPAADSESSP